MDHHAISQQILVEHQTLAYVASALRSTLGWHYQGADLTRKLNSLKFVAESFQRHLKHLMTMEEADGYMGVVVADRPDMVDQVELLRKEHGVFRRGMSRVLSQLRKVEPADRATFEQISHDLTNLLEQLDEHHRKETGLLQEALLRDEGGEG